MTKEVNLFQQVGHQTKQIKNASAATNKEEKTIIRFKNAVVTAQLGLSNRGPEGSSNQAYSHCF